MMTVSLNAYAAAAIYKLLAELTTRPEPLTFGGAHECATAAELAAEFCREHLGGAAPDWEAFAAATPDDGTPWELPAAFHVALSRTSSGQAALSLLEALRIDRNAWRARATRAGSVA